MSSLYDKLRRSQPVKPQAQKPAAQDCMRQEDEYSLTDLPLKELCLDTLWMMLGREPALALAPEQLLFVDTETTGLGSGAGTLAFLVGLGRVEGNRFVVRQFLMRDYDEEAFMLKEVQMALSECQAIVSFNGASFDLPLLQSRSLMNRLQWPELPFHIDLLHIARRVYKMRLESCTLGRLEAEVFREPRVDDLPGSMIPERYFRFLKTRELALLDDILLHNSQDVFSMLRLLFGLARLHEQPLEAEDHRDLFSLGRVFEKRGERGRAGDCYSAVSETSVKDMAQLKLAELACREGRHEEAAKLYEQLLAQGIGAPKVHIALAKLYEHRLRDPGRALAIARQGMLYCLECLDGADGKPAEFQDLERRIRRLINKTGGSVDGLYGRLQGARSPGETPEG